MNTVYFCMTPPQLSCPDIAFYAELTSQTTLTKGSKENAAYQLSTHCKTDLAGLKMDFDGRDSFEIFKAKCKYILKVIVLVVPFCKLMYSILLHSLG